MIFKAITFLLFVLQVWHFTTSPLLPNVAKLALATFIYSTWVYRYFYVDWVFIIFLHIYFIITEQKISYLKR